MYMFTKLLGYTLSIVFMKQYTELKYSIQIFYITMQHLFIALV